MMIRAVAPWPSITGSVGLGDMLERRVDLFLVLGHAEPGLDARQFGPVRALVAGRALAVRDAVAGGHQIDRAGLDPREGAERIAMVDRAGEQIGHGRQVDVRVRAHVDAGADVEMRRPHLVEEDERADHLVRFGRERAVDLEPAQIVRGRA